MTGWIVFLVVALPVVVVLAYLVLDESIVRIEPGEIGVLLVRGKATDRSVGPGVHFVPALRRRTVVTYPSLELAYRAGVEPGTGDAVALERSGPAVVVLLGDRTHATVSYTVRFILDPDGLRTVHDRFGADGIWSAVRDLSAGPVRTVLGDPETTVLDTFGAGRAALADRLAEAVATALRGSGFATTAVELTDIGLGRTGDVIQATARAPHELDRERAEAELRRERARTDGAVAEELAGVDVDVALRYREVDAWRDVAVELARRPGGPSPVPSPPRSEVPPSVAAAPDTDAGTASGPAVTDEQPSDRL